MNKIPLDADALHRIVIASIKMAQKAHAHPSSESIAKRVVGGVLSHLMDKSVGLADAAIQSKIATMQAEIERRGEKIVHQAKQIRTLVDRLRSTGNL